MNEPTEINPEEVSKLSVLDLCYRLAYILEFSDDGNLRRLVTSAVEETLEGYSNG